MSQEEKPWFNHSQMIANIMSARMKELGMTQKMLAEKMNCTQQYISKILTQLCPLHLVFFAVSAV